jgi:hypothetical protein
MQGLYLQKVQPIEQEFGILRFEIGEINGKGQPEKFCYLTEDQASYAMALSCIIKDPMTQ